MRLAMVTAALLALLCCDALANHVVFNGASVNAREIEPAADGSPRILVGWRIDCSGASYYGGVIMLYSYAEGREIAAANDSPLFPSSRGSVVTDDPVPPGRYKPRLFGASCGAPPTEGEGHAAQGPRVIDGPDFEVCARAGTTRARGSRRSPVIPVSGCGSSGGCASSARAALARPVIPVADGCRPDCEPSASAALLLPVVPARETCGPETVTPNGEAPVPMQCPGGASGSRARPVVPAGGPCSGTVKLMTSKPMQCASAVSPVIHCSALRRKRIALGKARFRLKAGKTAIVLVKLPRNGRRTMRQLKKTRVRATIVLRKKKRRVRTVRTFTLRYRS